MRLGSSFRQPDALPMVVVSESVHPQGCDFRNQRKIVLLRQQGLSFPQIAREVKNLVGGRPTARTCWNYYAAFSMDAGRRKSQYKKCGRTAWKLTPAAQRFALKTLKKLRKQMLCTAATLRAELARERGVVVAPCTIRKFLKWKGYKWLPRAQKRKYSNKQKRERLHFAREVVAMGPAKLRKKLAMSMDGCILHMPPRDPTERVNFLRHLQTHMWRLKSERLQPELSGHDVFAKQIALTRSIPLWGGIGPNGFATVVFHRKKKLSVDEWLAAVKAHKFVTAVKQVSPDKPRGPWHILCDNERFLHAAASVDEYRKQGLRMWKIPARSPDLNPIERFWSFLKQRLQSLDLRDALRKRPCMGKNAYKARVRQVLRSRTTRTVARNILNGYIRTCREIVRKHGAASSG